MPLAEIKRVAESHSPYDELARILLSLSVDDSNPSEYAELGGRCNECDSHPAQLAVAGEQQACSYGLCFGDS